MHFSVMVIGEKPEEQLLAFEEFGANGTESEFVKDIDITKETKRYYERHKKENQTFAEFARYWTDYNYLPKGVEKDIKNTHQWGYIELNDKGEVERVVERMNPNGQWDWYRLGGRWSGVYIILKDGATSGIEGDKCWGDHSEGVNYDSARIKDIDFEALRERAKAKIRKAHDSGENIEKAFNNLENNLIVTYAIIKDGVWYERNNMVELGLSQEEPSEEQWAEFCRKTREELSEDTLISFYDLHN